MRILMLFHNVQYLCNTCKYFFSFFFFFLIVDFLMQIQNHACINYDKIKLTSKIFSKTSNHAVLELIVLEQLSLNLLFSCPCKKNRRKLTEIIRNVLDCMVLEMSTLCCCLYTCILLLFVFFLFPTHVYYCIEIGIFLWRYCYYYIVF